VKPLARGRGRRLVGCGRGRGRGRPRRSHVVSVSVVEPPRARLLARSFVPPVVLVRTRPQTRAGEDPKTPC